MVDYTHYKVNELKDFLRKRNLPLSGTKSELIKCLTENDALTATEEPEKTAEENKEEPEDSSNIAVTEDVEAKTETVEEPVKGPEPARNTEPNVASETSDALPSPQAPSKSELTDDEFLAQFTNDLTKQIKRAERFGSDASELEARLKRVQKFGISAVRDAASKSSGEAQKRRSFQRKGNKKLKRGPRPATA